MKLHISLKDGTPIYLQIMQQIKYLIACGRAQPDDELPPVRALAKTLLVNPNTVARAYRDLETAGLVYKRHGMGVYVSQRGSPLAAEERRRIINDRINGLLAEASQLHFSVEEILDFVREQARELAAQQQEGNLTK